MRICMGKTVVLDIQGSPNVGLFCYVTDTYCLLGRGLPEEVKKSCEKAFDVPVHEISIAESAQIGAFVTGNSKGIVVPSSITPSEAAKLDELKITYTIIDTKFSALGNNVVVNDSYMFYIPEMEATAVQAISKALGVKGEPLVLKNWECVGAIVVINRKGGLIQKDVPDEVKDKLSEKLQLPFEQGTINFGSHVLGGGVAANSKGMLIGNASAGVEIANAELAFGFLE